MSYREVIKLANRFLKYSQFNPTYKFHMLNFTPSKGGGVADIYFPNGYGAVVEQNSFTSGPEGGKYGLTLIGPDGKPDFSTWITNDYLKDLKESDITRLLNEISTLKPKKSEKSKKSKRSIEIEISHLAYEANTLELKIYELMAEKDYVEKQINDLKDQLLLSE